MVTACRTIEVSRSRASADIFLDEMPAFRQECGHDANIPTNPRPATSRAEPTACPRGACSCLLGFLSAYGLAASGFDIPAIGAGLGTIIVSPDILINDYTEIAGMGPAFINSALCVLVALWLLKVLTASQFRVRSSRPYLTIAGFSLFGKNIAQHLAGLPGRLGVFAGEPAAHSARTSSWRCSAPRWPRFPAR